MHMELTQASVGQSRTLPSSRGFYELPARGPSELAKGAVVPRCASRGGHSRRSAR